MNWKFDFSPVTRDMLGDCDDEVAELVFVVKSKRIQVCDLGARQDGVLVELDDHWPGSERVSSLDLVP